MKLSMVKQVRRERRKKRTRKKVFGTALCPRLSVFRSDNHIYAQLIDDSASVTLVEASTRSKDARDSIGYGGNVGAATVVGKLLGMRATIKGISTVVFDRNGYRYHGRVKALATAVREAGLKF
jgi:large subunit ribosomal protein L18